MNKYKEIESVLDMRLPEWLVDELGVYWKAFHEEPLKYDGTIVVPMVRQYCEQRLDDMGEVMDLS